MRFIIKNIYKLVIISVVLLFILISVFLILKYKNQLPSEKRIFSRNDYRIFACGEEIFLKEDVKSLTTKGNGLFLRSKNGSIVADGVFLNNDDILLTSFFDAAGGSLEFSNEQKNILHIPTETGMLEFQSGDFCEGKAADLYVIHHGVDISKKPWSIYSRIMWKYFDYVLTNNYNEVFPRDCFIFVFDSEDALKRPWPHCSSNE